MGTIIQLSNLALMFLQSIVIPYLIGLDAYGEVVLYLLPLFFANVILDVLYVKMSDSGNEDSILSTSLFFIFFIVAINIYLYGIDKKDFLLLPIIFFYVYSLAFKGILYHKKNYEIIAKNEVISVLSYLFVTVMTYAFFLERIYVYMFSLLTYSVISSILCFFTVRRYLLGFNFNFGFIKSFYHDIFISILWKSYQIYINIFLLFILSFFYPNSFVASLKIVFSICSVVKFLMPCTLAMFFNSVKEDWLFSLKRVVKIQIFSIFLCFLLFYIGRELCERIKSLDHFLIIFEDVKLFLSYPVVVFSVNFAIFFITFNKILIFFLISSISFVVIIIFIFLGVFNFYWIFLSSMLFYQIFILTYIYFFIKRNESFS